MDFKDRVALITGGANGLGRATAQRLVEAGAKVVLADIEPGPGRDAARELDGIFVEADLSRPEASQAAVEAAVAGYGGLDIAFLNAGVATGCGLVESFDLGLYRRAMGVNLDGVVFGLNAVVPALRERGGGSIVATSSLAGLAPVPFDPIYAANKHAVVGLARSLGPDSLTPGSSSRSVTA
jgi:NAD(P)-dependent dehydrogenase (short-subunit alcohol dehydrogenase family)